MNKNINMDRVVNAIEKLETINGEPEYIVLKKQIASLQRELTIFKDAMKQKLKFKMTRWGLVVPNDTILKQWQKEKAQIKQHLTAALKMEKILGITLGEKILKRILQTHLQQLDLK